MITGRDLLSDAVRLMAHSSPPSESERRRAVSTAYYGLFHILIEVGTQFISGGHQSLRAQVARAYNHTTAQNVCAAFWRSLKHPIVEPYLTLLPGPIDRRLIDFAGAFIALQSARTIADYSLDVSFPDALARERVTTASMAAENFQTILTLPETSVFVTAVLLSKNWTRRE